MNGNPGTFTGTFLFGCDIEKEHYYLDPISLKTNPSHIELDFEAFCNRLKAILHQRNPDCRIIIKPLQYDIYPTEPKRLENDTQDTGL